MATSVPPAGTSPASAYSLDLDAEPLPPPAILADAIGAEGDWTTLVESATIADGMVRDLLGIERGSGAAVRELGQRFRFLRHVDEQSTEVLETMVAEALRPAVEAGVLEIVSVTVETDNADPSALHGLVEYRDLLAPPDAPIERFAFPIAAIP